MKYRHHPQKPMNFGELIIDNFAGGGGASTGIEQAVGRSVDIAINHNPRAVAMHKVNHPHTTHYCESVWDVDPRTVTAGRPVGLGWFSPDCRHFSKAKGKKPVSKQVRGLAWVVMKWAGTVQPRVIMLENVEEFLTWGPLIENERGELFPDPTRKGQTFKAFVKAIQRQGYAVDWQELRACDYGAPTTRKRLFMVARCDRQPIVWPDATHGPGLLPYRTAADIIDWSLPCPSIFGRNRPLADNTLRRIAEGIKRFITQHPKPFLVAKDGKLVAPYLVPRYGERPGQTPRTIDTSQPLPTIVSTGNHGQLVVAFLAKHYSGVTGHTMCRPIGTITSTDHHSLVTAHLHPDLNLPAGVGEHVYAFLVKYYSEGGQWQDLRDPVHTVPTKARLGLVTVHGQDYQIVDIGMRMLQPHELYPAQGFPNDYIFEHDADGLAFTKTEQFAMCGNSVPPPPVKALVHANYTDQQVRGARTA